MQAEVRLHVDIAADPVEVWRWLVDWPLQGEWIPLTRVRRVGGPPLGVGTQIVGRTAVGPLGFDDPMTVTAVELPERGSGRYEVVHTGSVVRGVGEFRVEPRPGGTRFCWWERVEVPGGPLGRALWLVGGPTTRLLFGWALRRLARAVEAGPGDPSGEPGG